MSAFLLAMSLTIICVYFFNGFKLRSYRRLIFYVFANLCCNRTIRSCMSRFHKLVFLFCICCWMWVLIWILMFRVQNVVPFCWILNKQVMSQHWFRLHKESLHKLQMTKNPTVQSAKALIQKLSLEWLNFKILSTENHFAQHKRHYATVLLRSLQLNGSTFGFHPDSKFRTTLHSIINSNTGKCTQQFSFECPPLRISSTDVKVRTTLYSTINSTTGKYCSVAFIWMFTLENFVHRLKRSNRVF